MQTEISRYAAATARASIRATLKQLNHGLIRGGAARTDAMATTVFRFSQCEVDTEARELRVAGELRAMEPRPFDLLVMLLRQRHRDVPTTELLDRLWPGESVTPGVVANAVAKVRRAIGDDGRPPLIRTVHRVGYRLVGDVIESAASLAASNLGAGGPAPLPLALLPFENLTGNPALDWITLGLMSLVRHALAQEERLAPLPVPVVLKAQQRCTAQADANERARAVQQMTGVRHVLHARIHRSGAGYRLDYWLLAAGSEMSGSLQADDPVALGRQLSRRLLTQLSSGGPAPQVDEAAYDPWAMEVLARAMEFSASRQWKRASQLLAVVLDIEPNHKAARLEQTQVQAMLAEAQGRFGAALDLWRDATSRARAAGQHTLAVRMNGRAALAAAMCGLREEALRRAEDGLAHAQASGAHDDLCRRTAQMCLVHAMLGHPLPPLPIADAHSPSAVAEDARAAWWALRGHVLAQRRDHEGAAQCFASAVGQYRSAGAKGREASLLPWWVDSLLRAGHVAEAEKVMQHAEASSGGHGFLLRALPLLRARVRQVCGDRAGALAALAPVFDGPAMDLCHAVACALAAHLLIQDGQLEQACRAMSLVQPGFAGHPLVSAAMRAVQATA